MLLGVIEQMFALSEILASNVRVPTKLLLRYEFVCREARLAQTQHAGPPRKPASQPRELPVPARAGKAAKVTESARACSYFSSKPVEKTCKFWLLTFWLLTLHLRVFLTLFSGFVHF